MKKLICLILALTVILSSMSVFASKYYDGYEYMDAIFKYDVGDFIAVDENDVVENEIDADTNRMMLLETLGLWDDASISKDELVSMQDFSKILSMVRLGTKNSFASVYELNATEEYATYNHAYTYLVEALGYSYKCKQYPNAEGASLIVAAEIGLLNEKPENINSYITRGELSKLIYKAINMDLCVVEYPDDGGYRHTIVEGKTLLNSVHDIFLTEGFVNGIPGLNVYGAEKIRDGYIQINRHEIKDGGIDATKYFASRVQAYTKYDSLKDEYTLIAIDFEEDAEIFEVDFRNITYVNNNEIGYIDENGTEDIYNVSNLQYVLENGEQLDSIANICDYSKNEGLIRFVSSTDSGEIDTAVIYKYNYYVVNNVDKRLLRIVLRYNRTYNNLPYIQINDHAPMTVYIDNVKSDYSKLVAGSVVKFFECPSTGYIWIDAKTTSVINGTPEMIYDNLVTVDGKEYRLAKDWELYVDEKKGDTSIISSQRPKELELGANTTFYVIDDIIAAYTSSQSYKYGFIKSASQSRTSLDPELTLRIFNQDAEWVDYVVSEKIEFEGQAGVSSDVILAAFNDETRIADFFDHPVRFRANGENKLIALDTVYESQYETDSDDDMVFTRYCGMARDYTFEGIGRDVPFLLSDETMIFVCPDGSDNESDYKMITNTQMPTASGATLVPTKVYNLNAYNQISLMVITKALDASGGKKEWYYIEKITDAVIDADDQIYGYKISGKMFKGIDRGQGVLADFFFYADEKMMNKNEVAPGEDGYTTDNILEVGDFINATVTGTNVASWDMELKGGIVPEPTPTDDGVSDKKNISLDAYIANGKFVRASAESGVWLANVDGVNMAVVPSVKAIINPVTKKVIEADVSDFFEGDNVYYRWEYSRGKFFIKNEY